MHWTKQIKEENAHLRMALDIALKRLRMIPESRLRKERQYPHDSPDAGLVYRTCAEECARLAEAARGEVLDILASGGIGPGDL